MSKVPFSDNTNMGHVSCQRHHFLLLLLLLLLVRRRGVKGEVTAFHGPGTRYTQPREDN